MTGTDGRPTPHEPVLIAFEGLDGTGKSHLTTELSRATGVPRVSTPGPAYDSLRHELHAAGGLASYLMYLSGCAWAVESARASGAPALVADRYWFSSAVQHGWNTGLTPGGALAPAGLHALLPQPRLTVLLVADREARLQRLARRRPVGTPLGDSGQAYEQYWLDCAEVLRDESRTRHSVLVLDTTVSDTAPPLAELLAHPVVRGIAEAAVGRLAMRGTRQ
ncbi:hypothetical protein AB0D94_02090 [Streptomyces sp. NPDC048255]|uniref:hypothetical protein n=1 Tax=Streptomyces sp. NPDC048255 TaxID=3154713 RepID=UPI0033C580A1